MRVLVDVVDALGVEARRAAYDSMDLVSLFQKQLCQVRAVLASDAGYKGYLAVTARLGRKTRVVSIAVFLHLILSSICHKRFSKTDTIAEQ